MTLEQEQIEMRNKITEEYIEYLRKNNGIISQRDQTRMKNTNTTFGNYFGHEQSQVIKNIKEKISSGEKLTKIEENRLENYNKIFKQKESFVIEMRNKITEEYIEYLRKNNGIIKKNDQTRMNNAEIDFRSYLKGEYRAIKTFEEKMAVGEKLTKIEENRLENYNKIIVEKDKFQEEKQIDTCNKITEEYIEYLRKNNGIISQRDQTRMKNIDTTFGRYLDGENQRTIKKIEEKISLGEKLTKVEENRLENYNKIIIERNKLQENNEIDTRNKITEEYMEYLIKNNGIISSDETRMKNIDTTFGAYFYSEQTAIKKIKEKISSGEKLTKIEENRLENYNKIFKQKESFVIEIRNKVTEEYIDYLRKNNGIISRDDQTRMKNVATSFGVYLNTEQRQAIKKIEEKISLGEKLTKVEENRLENYYNIIAVKEELIGKKTKNIDISTGNLEKDKIIKELKKKLAERRKNNKRPVWNYNIGEILKHFDVDINLLNTYLSRVSSGTQKSNPIMYSENESLRNYCIRNGFNYSVIFRAIKLKQFCKNDTLEQLINRAVTNYQIKGQNTPATWIYEKYGYVAKHILLRLGLSSEDIFRDMTSHVINLEEAMRHDYFKKNVLDKKHAWLEELLNYLMEQIDYTKEEEEIINQIANEIYSFEDIYKLTEEEFKILLNVLKGYIDTLKEYNICDVGLEENEKERARKIKDYNLDEYEIEESFLIPLEFEKGVLLGKKSSLYKRRELLRTYIIDWNQYTDLEKQKIIATEKFTKEEINMINSLRNKIDKEIDSLRRI